jgi:hypothetical protein
MTFTTIFKTISPAENKGSLIEFHPEVIGILLKNFFAFGTFNIIWVTLFIVYIVGFNKSTKGRIIFSLPALLSFVVALFPYIFSRYFIYCACRSRWGERRLHIRPGFCQRPWIFQII